jgi:lipid-A-disaccharide synthase
MSAGAIATPPLSLMLVCGEPSGDQLGAELMAALNALAPGAVKFSGVGGAAMEREGLQSLFPLDDTAVMGLREVVPRIPKILARVREAADFAVTTKPDAVVLIDSPDFTHRIARRVKKLAPDIATVNYVAPQVWASRQYRARKMARYFDLVLALLPFEVPFFETYGLACKFVGHPVVERAARMTGGAALRTRLGIAPDAPLLAVLPGSRVSEVTLLMEPFKLAVAELARDVPGLVCVLPTVAHVSARVRAAAQDWPVPLHIVESEADKFAAFDAANVALAASGTVTTELALSQTPMVVAYRLGWLTHTLMRPLISAPFVTLVNIILGREAIPEFIQRRCTPHLLSSALLHLFRDRAAYDVQLRDMGEAMHALGKDGQPPSQRAARALLDFGVGRKEKSPMQIA